MNVIFSSSPVYAYIRRKQNWYENCQCGTYRNCQDVVLTLSICTALYIHIGCALYHFEYIVSGWLHTWIIPQINYEAAMVSSDHPHISSFYRMHELQHGKLLINPFYDYWWYTCTVCLFKYRYRIHMSGMYLCLGNGRWQKFIHQICWRCFVLHTGVHFRLKIRAKL